DEAELPLGLCAVCFSVLAEQGQAPKVLSHSPAIKRRSELRPYIEAQIGIVPGPQFARGSAQSPRPAIGEGNTLPFYATGVAPVKPGLVAEGSSAEGDGEQEVSKPIQTGEQGVSKPKKERVSKPTQTGEQEVSKPKKKRVSNLAQTSEQTAKIIPITRVGTLFRI